MPNFAKTTPQISTSGTLGMYWSGKAHALEFCQGFGGQMVSVIQSYNGLSSDDINLGPFLIQMSILIAQIQILTELGIYIVIFWTLYNANQTPKLGLTKDTINKRNRKNVITLSGQVISFFIETLCAIIMSSLYSGFELVEPAAVTPMLVIASSIISVSQIVTSPELRQFYFKW